MAPIWYDIANLALGAGQSIYGQERGFAQEKKLMGIQHQNQQQLNQQQYERQRLLNQQGKDLSLQQWKDTNYPAQIKMLQEAGLNPALLYGMSGAGGSTAQTGSGGNAQGGQASKGSQGQFHPMDIAGLSKLQAEKELIDAQTNKVKSETKESASRIAVNEGIVTLNLSQEELNDTAAALNKSKAQTEHTVRALNSSLAKLNNQKTIETITNTKLSKATLNWMEETGLHPNDSALGKTVQYLAEQTGQSQETIIYLVGGLVAARELLRLLPKELLNKLMPGKNNAVGGFMPPKR